MGKQRSILLYPIEEAATRLRCSEKTVQRLVKTARKKGTLYEERHVQRHDNGKGGRERLYLDLHTLGIPVPPDPESNLSRTPPKDTDGSQGQMDCVVSQTANIATLDASVKLRSGTSELSLSDPSQGHGSAVELARFDPSVLLADSRHIEYRDTDPEAARQLHAELLPVLNTRPGSHQRGVEVRQLAAAKGVDESTIRDWVTRFQKDGLSGLQPKARQDKGGFRVPQETLQIICAALVTNPPTTSARQIHSTLLMAVPDAMITKRAGRAQFVSVATISRIRDAILAHPQLRVLMMQADARKEFLRTWVGRVLAAHANDLWEQDMTRCDVEVFDEETNQIYRPRVQAIIDVFSGCIPGIGFSPDEDQIQADLAFFRALLPPRPESPLAAHYPIYGKPRRLYIDNGKTYASEHFERVARELGIEMVHSKPYVSHTRGHIERFFRTLHIFEQTLPGYVGNDAVNRGSEELERLTQATKRWRETGRDPGEGRRHLTLREYQNAVLNWLIVDYHQHVVDGKTRLEWFTSTAPASSLIRFDMSELIIHFAHRTERVVRPDCTVQVDNVLWACMDGSLGSYAGTRVLVLRDAMILGDDIRIIAARQRNGSLRILGAATRAPDNALSVEAGELRRANKLHKRGTLDLGDEFTDSVTDPAFLVRKQHERQLPVQPIAALPPVAQAQITAVKPEVPDLGDFGKSFLRADEPGDMDDFMRSLREEE